MIELLHKKTGAVLASIDAPYLAKADLSNMSLSGVDLKHRKLFYVDFTNTDLSDADLTKCNTPYVRMHGANLQRAKFEGAQISEGDMSDADLTDADVRRAILFAVNTKGAKLHGIRLSLSDVSFCDFSERDMSNSHWRFVDFRHVKMARANFEGSQFTCLTFRDCDLQHASFAECKLSITLRNCNLEGLDFTGSTLRDLCVINCNNLHLVKGLTAITHKPAFSKGDPSSIDMATLRSCLHGLPDEFLLGLGFAQDEIALWRKLYSDLNRETEET
jgi:uncharacterized protein YjbI with pentapeptide repeats